VHAEGTTNNAALERWFKSWPGYATFFAAASQMSEQDRNTMVRAMVARLADRLKQNGTYKKLLTQWGLGEAAL